MPAKTAKQRDSKQLVGLQLRFREALRRELEEAANASGNSMNAEIVERLNKSLSEDQLLGRGPTRNLLIEMAAQIAHAEAATGKPWHEDPATHRAAKELALDVWSRSKPQTENAEEVTAISTKLIVLREQRRRLIAHLKRYGAVEARHRDEVGDVNASELLYVRRPQELWRNPHDPEAASDEIELALVDLDLEELADVDRQIDQLNTKLDELMGPWRAAEERGKALYQQISAAELNSRGGR